MNSTSSLYDLDFRNFDPVLGRMHQVDPMAGKYGSTTPYNFSFNNPVSLNDPSGADPFARDDFWREADMQNRTMLNMGTPCNCSNNLVVLNRTHITPGSAGDWMNGNRSMRANFALMSRSTFEDFYNIDLDNPEDRQKVAESLALTPRAAAQFLARLIEGASLSSTGRYVEIPSYRLMYKEGNQLKYRALPSTWLPVGDIFQSITSNQTQGGNPQILYAGIGNIDPNIALKIMGVVNYANNVTATAYAITDLHHAQRVTKLTPSQVSNVAKVSKGTVILGAALTYLGAYYEYETGQANTHTVTDVVVGTGVAVVGAAAIVFSAPVWGTAAAVVGLGYGIWSLAGGSSRLDEATNNWGKDLIYGN